MSHALGPPKLKEHVLGASDRAALQSLIPLAGALGAGTIFGLFFGGRKWAGFAVFEIFATVSVLVAVGSTAYFCIALLHADEAITDSDLAKTATPLVFGAFLLVFVSILSRLPGSFERVLMLVPLALGAAFVAALIAGMTAWNTDPAHASLAAILVLAVGAVLSLLTAWVDRMDLSWDRRSSYSRMLRLWGAGYLRSGGPLSWVCRPPPRTRSGPLSPAGSSGAVSISTPQRCGACAPWPTRLGRPCPVEGAGAFRLPASTAGEGRDLAAGGAPPAPGAAGDARVPASAATTTSAPTRTDCSM